MKHQFTQEQRSKGGKNQPREAKSRGGMKGYETTVTRYPFMARHWLKYAPGMRRFQEGKFAPNGK